ncbi:hypothetical protein PRZ48_003455 [Zasmidium cellare]|uniref:rRNA-processing protein FYV7 n=1 Tax=Zasmidium cellare TaxID=395010 RepID=A0ABR0EVG7_ZASCE|nr:hypothetical protein PRZ48_003455 [Zasmidium cellare]
MSEKRKRDQDDGAAKGDKDRKKQKRGFAVGPDNLPDGTYRRKTQKIKQNLIDKAKIKKEYAKLKKHGQVSEKDEELPQPASLAVAEEEEPSAEPHPDRQTLIEKEAEEPEQEDRSEVRQRKRRPKAVPFQKEHEEGQKRKAEAEARRKAREKTEAERSRKIEERERFRRAMAKARTGGPNGQRKLGRESKVLLEKVKRMVGGSG